MPFYPQLDMISLFFPLWRPSSHGIPRKERKCWQFFSPLFFCPVCYRAHQEQIKESPQARTAGEVKYARCLPVAAVLLINFRIFSEQTIITIMVSSVGYAMVTDWATVRRKRRRRRWIRSNDGVAGWSVRIELLLCYRY